MLKGKAPVRSRGKAAGWLLEGLKAPEEADLCAELWGSGWKRNQSGI